MARAMGMRNLAALAIDPAVIVEQQIFTGVHLCDFQVAVIGLQAGSGEALHHLAQLLLLHHRIRCQIVALAASGLRADLIPLVRRPIALDDGGVDHLAHAEAENKEHADKRGQRGEEHHNAVDVDVGDFIAGRVTSGCCG